MSKPAWCMAPAPCDYDKGSSYCLHRECRTALEALVLEQGSRLSSCEKERDMANAKLSRIRDVNDAATEIDDIHEELERDLEEAIVARVAAESRLDKEQKNVDGMLTHLAELSDKLTAAESRLDESATEIQRLRAALLKRETETVSSSEFQRVCADRDSYADRLDAVRKIVGELQHWEECAGWDEDGDYGDDSKCDCLVADLWKAGEGEKP